MFDILFAEAKKIVRDPRRLGEAFRPRRWRQLASIIRFNSGTAGQWEAASGAGLRQRKYASYDDYVAHQRSKLSHLDLSKHEPAYRRQLAERLRAHALVRPGSTVLCLAARRGAEVAAFHDLGCFAVGIDLNPGPENPLVLPGDFHNVQFPSASVDVVFTNSFDHSLDPSKLISEIIRLLKPGGLLVVEAIRGDAEAMTPDYYASLWWAKVDDLVALLDRNGFETVHRSAFKEPWPGEHLCLRRKAGTQSSVSGEASPKKTGSI
jgi:SAM-dependent methyltransferase